MKNWKSSLRKIAWGVFLMAAAVLVIANGYYKFMEFWPLVCVIVMTPIVVSSLWHFSFAGVFIPIAVLGIVFSKQLGIEAITPWPILAAAVLLSIGFSIIFHKKDKWLGRWHMEENETFENVDDDEMTCTVKFGSSTKFIRSENFEKAYLNCRYGAIKAYFDNAKLSPDGAELNIAATCSGIELFIPKHWRISNGLDAFLGGVEEKSRNVPDPDSPVLTITGNIKLSGIVIYYV